MVRWYGDRARANVMSSEGKKAKGQPGNRLSHPCFPHFQVAVTLGNEQGQKSCVNREKAWRALDTGRSVPKCPCGSIIAWQKCSSHSVFFRHLCEASMECRLPALGDGWPHLSTVKSRRGWMWRLTLWHYLQASAFPLNTTLPRKKWL